MKYSRFIFVFLILMAFVAVSHPAKADEITVKKPANTAEDTPVILPTNPFYFAKELARDVRWFFTFGTVNKAAYELRVADEKALEVREVEKISPKNTEAIKKALSNYQNDVADLSNRIDTIKSTATDPRVSKLLDAFADQAVRNAELFQGLKVNDSIKDSVKEAQETVTSAATMASAKLDTPEAASARIQKIIQTADPVIKDDVRVMIESSLSSQARDISVETVDATPTDAVDSTDIEAEAVSKDVSQIQDPLIQSAR